MQIVEVGPRDGLQNEPELVAAGDKIALIVGLMDAGVRRLEVASFVDPRRVPQMADAEQVIAGLPDRADVSYIGLCLNPRGVARAADSRRGNKRGVDEAGCVLVATDAFGLRNQGQTVEQGLRANAEMLRLGRAEGLVAQVTISAAFGCPFEGEVPQARIIEIAKRLAEHEPAEVAVADTIGVAAPGPVRDLIGALREVLPETIRLRAHFHDTRGTGIANAWEALRGGCTVLDSSLGGLGGCPFAPKATGNIATEDLVYMLERSGVETGVDLDAALAVNASFEGVLGRPLPSRVGKAGSFPKPK